MQIINWFLRKLGRDRGFENRTQQHWPAPFSSPTRSDIPVRMAALRLAHRISKSGRGCAYRIETIATGDKMVFRSSKGTLLYSFTLDSVRSHRDDDYLYQQAMIAIPNKLKHIQGVLAR